MINNANLTERSRAAVLEAWRVFKTRDAEQISRLFTEDAEWLAPRDNATAIALGGSHHIMGNARIAQFLSCDMHKIFQNIQIEFRGVFADGNTVVVEERMRATVPHGAYDNDYCFVFELEGAQIKRVREYMDTLRGKAMIFGSD